MSLSFCFSAFKIKNEDKPAPNSTIVFGRENLTNEYKIALHHGPVGTVEVDTGFKLINTLYSPSNHYGILNSLFTRALYKN